jgi:periplasmic divalent cation tolerance protein
MSAIVVFITASGEEEAAKIARALVEERLAACVNIIRGVRSVYAWKGEVQDEAEALMVLKTREALFDPIKRRVRQLHSYDVPEVIAVPITRGLEVYMAWMEEVTREA